MAVGQCEGVSSGEKDVSHLRGLLDISDGLLPLRDAALEFAVVADHARPGAVPAVCRAETRGQEENAVGITMDQSGDRALMLFGERVLLFPGATRVFIRNRNDGSSYGLRRICGAHKTGVVRGYPEGKPRRSTLDGVILVRSKSDDPLDLVQAADAVPDLPVPACPVDLGRIRIEISQELARTMSDGYTTG